MSELTLGSLFDGSGGFPLAGIQAGIRPVWASEIEPFPILVTTRRLPQLTHVGDVTEVNGADVDAVDVITFGSPCQDPSVAGKQAGLAGERSGLFFHAVRIIEEMRKATHGMFPRYAIWENVPGAFSSHKGADFATVLTTLTRIVDPSTPDMPVPEGGWPYAGCVMGEGFSLAWRVLDAQYFGVAQRRRRIYLVCDFAGQSAPEILFESASLPRHSESCGTQEQDHAHTPEASLGGRSSSVILMDHHPQDSRLTVNSSGVVQTLTARMGNSPTNVPILLDAPEERRVFGLNSIHQSRSGGGHYGYEAEVSKTLDLKGGEPTCNQGGMVILEPVYATSKADYFTRATKNQAGALLATDYTDPPMVASSSLLPRRLTPVECARLQGFPDDWCDGLAIEDPTSEDIEYWTGIWATWNWARGVKPRTARQVTTWLKNPTSDSAQYKL
ncbi:DNA cytosine methyltransferase [Corynebacterium striatum]|uniref:DNA cytosine methyltransferase n=1 Tax=Corynebacterium striatum TaxID=43770 RepID=UPI0027B9EF57|nr:DNA cytosine methyltransferase [Corynebacterium striatum]